MLSMPDRPGRLKLRTSSRWELKSFCTISHRCKVLSSSKDRILPCKFKHVLGLRITARQTETYSAYYSTLPDNFLLQVCFYTVLKLSPALHRHFSKNHLKLGVKQFWTETKTNSGPWAVSYRQFKLLYSSLYYLYSVAFITVIDLNMTARILKLFFVS